MTNPSTLIFLGLAVVWAIVLLPEGIKRFSRMRRSDSIRSFNHQLLALDRSGPTSRGVARVQRDLASRDTVAQGSARAGRIGTPDSNVIDFRAPQRPPARPVPRAVRRRRQEVTATLTAAVVVTLLCLVAFGPVFIVPQLIADALLGAYLYMVAQANRTASMAGSVVLSVGGDSRGPRADDESVIRVRPVVAGVEPVAATR